MIDRRMLLAAGAAMGATATARAEVTTPAGFVQRPLWPGTPPGGEQVRITEQVVQRSAAPDDVAVMHVARPTLTRLLPARPNGAALLLVPGGGYRRVAMKPEGFLAARHFAAQGFACYILLYRLPGDGWAAGPDAPLQDAQRAMRLVRAEAASAGFEADRVAAIGFSAGGHLTARLANEPAASYAPLDAADALPFRPRVAGLIYPVITMEGPLAHGGSRDELLGPSPSPDRLRRYSAERLVGAATPPSFIAQAADDPAVPVGNSFAMFDALQRAGIPRELHMFESGGHGFGLTLPDGTPSPWPDLFAIFARRHGLIH
jgi:acetyl esterase/lipase